MTGAFCAIKLILIFDRFDANFSFQFYFTDPTFFPGRSADILFNGKVIGQMGVVHPEVLGKFEITNPCAALEINLEVFL